MKKMIAVLLSLAALALLSACGGSGTQTIKIAVIGNPDTFYPGYRQGVERAARDLASEYADSGYSVECVFAGGDSYEDSAALIDQLSADRSVTAVIGAVEMEVNQTAAEVCERGRKLLVIPYFLNDSVYENNNYTLVFSMCNSGSYVGRSLRRAAVRSGKVRWAVCTENREFELDEVTGFLASDGDDSIQVVDCVNIAALQNNFDEIYTRWEILGVEGVIMFPEGDEGFDLLVRLKRRNPELVCGGDTAFDNSFLLDSDPEIREAMTGFLMVDESHFREARPEETERIAEFAAEYFQLMGTNLDIWYLQGYNAVRMVVDTAVENHTANPVDIARHLHENGYDGLLQDLRFHGNGSQIEGGLSYNVFGGDGYAESYSG